MAFRARYDGHCYGCKGKIRARTDQYEGDQITWTRDGKKRYYHIACKSREGGDTTEATTTETQTHESGVQSAVERAMADLQDAAERTAEQDGAQHETETETEAEAEATPPPPSGDLGAVLAAAVKPHLDGKTDRREVEAIVAEAMAKLEAKGGGVVTHEVEIKTAEGTKKIESTHEDFASILEHVQLGRSIGFSVYLYGDPGTGKSTMGQQVAKALGLDFYLCTLAPMSPPSSLIGYGTADGTQVETDAFKAYTRGGVLMVEEIDNANDGVLTSFNAALANGKGSWPVIGTVEKHPDFVLIGAGNTPGLGPTRSFPARRKLDAAFRDRFVFKKIGYDLGLEERLALECNNNANEWVRWCRNVRQWAADNAPELFVTPRSIVFGAGLLRLDGQDRRSVAEATIFRGVEADLVDRALKACPAGA